MTKTIKRLALNKIDARATVRTDCGEDAYDVRLGHINTARNGARILQVVAVWSGEVLRQDIVTEDDFRCQGTAQQDLEACARDIVEDIDPIIRWETEREVTR